MICTESDLRCKIDESEFFTRNSSSKSKSNHKTTAEKNKIK